MRQATGYIRVSSDDQAENGVSLDLQRTRIAAWCTANGYELVSIHADEGLSGKDAASRPGLQAAIAAVTQTKGVLVVTKLDRMVRCTRDAIDIAEKLRVAGADLASIDERIDTASPMGEFVYTLMAALGQLERKQIASRVRECMAQARKQGRRLSFHLPMGYKLGEGRMLVKDPHEQRAVQMARRLAGSGLGPKAIRSRLVEAGVVGREGKPWSVTAIKRAVKV